MRGAADLHADGTKLAEQADGGLRESLYRRMLLIRRFEERVYRLFLEGEIPGTLHQYQGQEAVAVGVCDALTRDDWITSTHRPHGHALAKGVSARSAMAELYGKRTGCCGGKGGSMHLGDPDVGMLPAIAIVGGGNTVVTGLGLAMKLRRSDQVAVCFFGEGATNEGAFHEGTQLCRGRAAAGRAGLREQLVRRVHAVQPGGARPRRRRAREGIRRARTDRRRHGRAGRARGGTRRRGGGQGRRPGPRCWNARPTGSPGTAAATRAGTGPARRKPGGRREIRCSSSARA